MCAGLVLKAISFTNAFHSAPKFNHFRHYVTYLIPQSLRDMLYKSTRKPQSTLQKKDFKCVTSYRKPPFDQKQRETQSHYFVNVEKVSRDAKNEIYTFSKRRKEETRRCEDLYSDRAKYSEVKISSRSVQWNICLENEENESPFKSRLLLHMSIQ